MINLGTKKPWCFNNGNNPNIDFCIWVLEKDGLRVSPFDVHPLGNGELQKAGMDAISWQNWLVKVVATQDNRLNWEVKNKQKYQADNLASFETTASISDRDINKLEIESALEKILSWEQEEYKTAVAKLGNTSQNAEPPDVWDGNLKIKDLLTKLWQEYLNLKEDRFSIFVDTPLNTYARLKPYQTHLATLQIYQINYPQLREYIIPPVAAILAVNSQENSDRFADRVLNVAQQLATI